MQLCTRPTMDSPGKIETVHLTTTTRLRIISEGETPLKASKKSLDKDKPCKNPSQVPSGTFLQNVEIVWRNVFIMLYIHTGALYGLYDVFFVAKSNTVAWGFLIGYLGAFGVTVGAHRLWAHKSYKATLPLRIFLAFMQTVSCQNSIHEWSRDHRVHHKFTETNADPHNATRGFFFAHVGWLLCKKHDDVKGKGKAVDMRDLEADPVVMIQKRYYVPLVLLCSFIGPTFIPCFFWGELFVVSWNVTLFRYAVSLHATWLVNSAAHLWGHKPYDRNINPAENKMVSIITNGEGWHNYHHVFPWDYKAAELGLYRYNLSTALIDLFAWMGLAYDLKTVPEKIVLQRVKRTGDGSYNNNKKQKLENVIDLDTNENSLEAIINGRAGDENRSHSWGWDDTDTSQEDKQVTVIFYEKSA